MSAVLAFALLALLRLAAVLPARWQCRCMRRRARRRATGERVGVMVVLGSGAPCAVGVGWWHSHDVCAAAAGGHTAEMMPVVAAFDRNRYGPVTFVVADSDAGSIASARAAGVRCTSMLVL